MLLEPGGFCILQEVSIFAYACAVLICFTGLSVTKVGICTMVRKRETSKVRQEQIIDAARKTIIKYGSEHVTVRAIAKAVGISEGAIYRHFKSKKEILSLLADHIEDDLVGEVTRASAKDDPRLEV